MHVAVDGWDLAVRPSSWEAWRTHELLELSGSAADVWRWSLIRPADGPLDLPAYVQAVEAESILGDAAYVTPADDTRALGAACLSLLVDDNLAESLRAAGVRRAAAFHSGRGVGELAGLLRRSAHLHREPA